MILCPLQNTAALEKGVWIQVRPVVTQKFGERPEVYAQFGMKGHNGLDFRAPLGTQVYAPMEGKVVLGNEGDKGYGKYIKIVKDNIQLTMAHLSEFQVLDGQHVYMGEPIAKSGNTGFSTAPHLHLTMKRYNNGQLLDAGNGFNGAVDPYHSILCWKGNLDIT